MKLEVPICGLSRSPGAIRWGRHGEMSVYVKRTYIGQDEVVDGLLKIQTRRDDLVGVGTQRVNVHGDGNDEICVVVGGVLRYLVPSPRDYVNCTSVSPDETMVAVGTNDGLFLYQVLTGELIGRCSGHEYGVSGISWSPDGMRVATCGGGKVIVWIWDVSTRRSVGRLRASRGVLTVDWSSNGLWIAIGTWGGIVLVYDAMTYRKHGCLVNKSSGRNRVMQMITDIKWSPDGNWLAAVDINIVKVWFDPRGVKRVVRLALEKWIVDDLAEYIAGMI